MPRSPDMVQFQCVMRPVLRNALDAAAIALRDPDGETASLDRGEMSRRLFRWFLSLPQEERAKIMKVGKEIADQEPATQAGGRSTPVHPRGLPAVKLPNPKKHPAERKPKGKD